jgi:acetyl esterase/lipase
MCFDYDSRPPELPGDLVGPPIAGGAAAKLRTLTSDDGTAFSAAVAEAAEVGRTGVVIIPDVRPVLGLFGGADEAIPAEQIEEFQSALSAAGVEHVIHIYPGAPHSFFDVKHEVFAGESEDAWRRILGFLAAIKERTPQA